MKDVKILVDNGVNVDKALELFGDMPTYDDTLETFLTEVDEKIENMIKYKEIADTKNYAILAHSLKSDAKYFGFDLLAALAYNHELESKENHIYYVYEHFDELLKETKRIINVVKTYLGYEIDNELEKTNEKLGTILVVDDSNVINTFVKKIFDDKYNIIIANDGKEAIDNLNNDDIVAMLLDLNMPNVNGFVVLEYLRLNNLFEKIPVSIITGVGDDEIVKKTFEYPIIDVLRKPFNERDIKIVLEKTINKGE